MIDQESTPLSWIPESTGPIIVHGTETEEGTEETAELSNSIPQDEGFLGVPISIVTSSSSDTLTGSISKYKLYLNFFLILNFHQCLKITHIVHQHLHQT